VMLSSVHRPDFVLLPSAMVEPSCAPSLIA
jgi:hypothetical protein